MASLELLLLAINTFSSIFLTLFVVALTFADVLNPDYEIEIFSFEEIRINEEPGDIQTGYHIALEIKNRGWGYGKITEILHITMI